MHVDPDERRLETTRARHLERAGELAAQQVVVTGRGDVAPELQPIPSGPRIHIGARRGQPLRRDGDVNRQPAVPYLIDFKPHFA